MAVLITGASMGIGRALALAWARRGATLVLSARSESALQDVTREARAAGATAIAVASDVTREADRERLVRCAIDAGGLEVLVNNAGRGFYAPVMDIDVQEMRDLFELNVIAPLRMVQLAAPELRERRGTIVMMSSIAGIIAAPRYGAYSASKFAVEAISMALRAELSASGVRVVVVRPGPVDTSFRSNATRAEGITGYQGPDPKAQRAEDVAEQTVRAVERHRSVVETSAYVRVASAASRWAPGPFRLILKRMANQPPS